MSGMSVSARRRILLVPRDWYEMREEVRTALAEWALRESEWLRVFDVVLDRDAREMIVELGYGSKYMEISEELYGQAYRDMLEEINRECVININRRVEYPEKGVVAEIYPIECSGDYCFCGAGITLRVSLEGVSTIEEGVRRVVDAVKYAYDRIYSEIIAPH